MSSKPDTISNISLAEAIAHRRTVYALKPSLPAGTTDAKVEALIKYAALHVPSAFNSQTTRMVLLVKGEHAKFWQGVKEILKGKMDEESYNKDKGRLDTFKGSYGSILFFEDEAVIKKMQERTTALATLFPEWSEHTSAMHQFTLWLSLEAIPGIGANLQHYNFVPQVTEWAKSTWNLPEEWRLRAQLVFGEPVDAFPTDKKEKLPTEETVRVFGA